MVLGDSVTGESSEVAKVYAALAREVRAARAPASSRPSRSSPAARPRSRCAARAAADAARSSCCRSPSRSTGSASTWALACDTDGIDGSEDNAGAILTPDALERARAAGHLAPKALLANNDGYGFFSALDDLVVTGPTRTNVNDYRVILGSMKRRARGARVARRRRGRNRRSRSPGSPGLPPSTTTA